MLIDDLKRWSFRIGMFSLAVLIGGVGIPLMLTRISAQSPPAPTITQTYGLTLEREDFTATAGQTNFAAQVATRSTFALVFRNGALQRPNLDYTLSGNLSVIYPATTMQAGDLVTLLYYR